MVTYTLDWNCLIALENSEPAGEHVKKLIENHFIGNCEVALLSTSASENMKGSRGFPASKKAFRTRIENLKLTELPILNTPAVIGLSFMGSYIVDKDEHTSLRNHIWSIVAPSIPSNHKEFATNQKITHVDVTDPAFSRWRNAWCDVHSLYCHIHEQRDVFVTLNAKDFQKHSKELAKLGADDIRLPSGCV